MIPSNKLLPRVLPPNASNVRVYGSHSPHATAQDLIILSLAFLSLAIFPKDSLTSACYSLVLLPL